ncbi:glycosyltransferase [Methanoregula formicica]|uniref:Glycosyltransferase n=1 Tax=Methanoregula formicica (strain DSM 22288 / NBRC 105244 / SMSP) TaxID=593750 RepID=L0HGI8_METFS|nr:glycosyltransferase [Methanoregula formicica]AGB02443.1 glycosyltransferase [Methanoregula formicica SMSP]
MGKFILIYKGEHNLNKDLLIIAPEYYSFVKDQTESIAIFFSNVKVLVRHNPIAEISTILPINSLTNFRKKNLINCINIPHNISVFPTPVYYAPLDFFYKRLGEQHFCAVNSIIRKNYFHFDLMHAHATWSSGYVGARLKDLYHVPFLVTAHGYDIYSLPFKDAIWKKKIEYVLNKADAVITVSQSNLKCIQKLDVDTPVYIIPNGFRSDLFSPREMAASRRVLGLPLDRKILLNVGNLEPVKGQKYLIDAVNEIIKERKDILCIVVGMGSEIRTLEKQILFQGLGEYVLLVGKKPHDEIPLWINACDIFVLPSLNEGNPTVMFEALGCGKPIIGTKVGGVPEVIFSEDYGLVVEPADIGDLADKIMMALDRKWDQKKILAYAKQFTWENIAKETLKVFTKISV